MDITLGLPILLHMVHPVHIVLQGVVMAVVVKSVSLISLTNLFYKKI